MNVVVFQCRLHGTVSHHTYDDACVATCFRGDDLALLFGRFTETGFSVGREVLHHQDQDGLSDITVWRGDAMDTLAQVPLSTEPFFPDSA